MSFEKKYEVGSTRLDNTYKDFVHELPLLSFGDARNTFGLSLIFQSKLTSNPFNIANGYKLNLQKRIIFSGSYPQSYEDGYGNVIKLNRFGSKYAFDDGSQRFIRSINGQYILENPDYSTEVFNASGNILSVKDKYGNNILNYTYSSGKLTLVVYKNSKTINIVYSNNVIQYIRYTHSGSTFKIDFTYSGNQVIVNHYSGVKYLLNCYLEYSNDPVYESVSKILEVRSGNVNEDLSSTYFYRTEITNGEGTINIRRFLGDKELDGEMFQIISCDTEGNVKMLNVIDCNGVSTMVQFTDGKPAYSYEYILFNEPEYSYYPGRVTYYNDEQVSGYQDYNNGIQMINCNSQNVVEPKSYYLMDNFSGLMTVSGWLKPIGDIHECNILISDDFDNEIASHLVTGLRQDFWTYFSVSFYTECGEDGYTVIHVHTSENNNVIDTFDFRLSGQRIATTELDEYKDNLVKSAGVLIYTDANGVDLAIPVKDKKAIKHPMLFANTAEFINGSSLINLENYPITAKDIMRYKINQMVGRNKGEIYYKNGRGILTLQNEFYARYTDSSNVTRTIPVTTLSVGKMYSSQNDSYVTKTNFYNEDGITKLKTESFKNSRKINSEVYDSKLDIIESVVEGVTTTYTRDANNGLVYMQTVTDSNSENEIVSSAVYDDDDFLVSTTDEFGVVTTYTTDATWGVVTKSVVTNGSTITDDFDDDFTTQVSRTFGNDANKKHEFSYLNGFLSTMKNDTLTYTMGYNGDTLSSVAKNNQSLAEFTIEEALLGEKETVNEYYPSSANPMFTVSRKYDIYDRIVEIDDLIKNTYDIGAFFIDGTYTTVGIDNGSAKLAVREDLITGIQTKFAYQNNRLERVGEFNFQGTTVNEETFTYDESGKLVEDKFTYDSGTNSVQHNITYVSEGGSNNSEGMISSYSYKVNGTQKAKTENTYDAYKRVTNKKYTVGGRVFNRGVEYDKTRVNKVIDSVAGTTLYEYDSMGRICQEKDVNNTIIRNYTYDDYGQLIREDNKTLDKTFVYEYNNIGNIVNVKTYDYTTGLLGDVISQQNFGYDTTNTDRLTNFAGTTVSYNSMGCPTTYNGHTVSWTRGKISKLSKGLKLSGIDNYYYSYNALGQRTDRSYTYTLPTLGASSVAMGTLIGYSQAFDYDQSGRLISESKSYQYYGESGSSDKIVYLYDANSIIGMIYTLDGATNVYYFQRNLLGDVVSIYGTGGNKVGEYAYDAWGNCTITLDTNGIASRNPIRYRGYYYDQDMKLYYLNARYYCPEWRRFISPDSTEYIDPENPNGLNLYVYCNNDPVNYVDPSGNAALTIGALLLIGFVSGAVIGAASSVAGQYIANGFSWDNFSVGQLVLDTVLGGVSGLLSMSTLGLGAMVAANAGIGFVGAVGGHLINGSDFSKLSTWLDIGLSTGLGALVGRIGKAGALNAGYLNGAKKTAGFIRAAGLYDDVLTKAANGFYRTSGIAANALRLSHYNLVAQWNKMIVTQAGNALAKALGYGGIALLIGTAGKGLLYDIYNDYF